MVITTFGTALVAIISLTKSRNSLPKGILGAAILAAKLTAIIFSCLGLVCLGRAFKAVYLYPEDREAPYKSLYTIRSLEKSPQLFFNRRNLADAKGHPKRHTLDLSQEIEVSLFNGSDKPMEGIQFLLTCDNCNAVAAGVNSTVSEYPYRDSLKIQRKEFLFRPLNNNANYFINAGMAVSLFSMRFSKCTDARVTGKIILSTRHDAARVIPFEIERSTGTQ